jgi:hypothetical protein
MKVIIGRCCAAGFWWLVGGLIFLGIAAGTPSHADWKRDALKDLRANKNAPVTPAPPQPAPKAPEHSGVGHAQETRTSEELRKQRLRDCLERADSRYHNAWVDACFSKRGGSSNGTDCPLPSQLADRLERNLNTARNFCFQISENGL